MLKYVNDEYEDYLEHKVLNLRSLHVITIGQFRITEDEDWIHEENKNWIRIEIPITVGLHDQDEFNQHTPTPAFFEIDENLIISEANARGYTISKEGLIYCFENWCYGHAAGFPDEEHELYLSSPSGNIPFALTISKDSGPGKRRMHSNYNYVRSEADRLMELLDLDEPENVDETDSDEETAK